MKTYHFEIKTADNKYHVSNVSIEAETFLQAYDAVRQKYPAHITNAIQQTKVVKYGSL